MNVAVRDAKVLKSVTPLELTTLLRASGWRSTRQIGDKTTVWQFEDDSDTELLVPARQELGDYPARVFDVLEALSYVTGRSHLQLLFDLSVSNTDVVRVRAVSPGVENGTINIREGAEFVKHSMEMMLAAASSTVQKQSVFLTRKPDRAVEYLDKVRLGQTEQGSFILTLLSPVAPSRSNLSLFYTTEGEGERESQEGEPPFERQVTELLARSLNRVKNAATLVANTGVLDPFKDAVQEGVTSNLCEALVGLHENGAQSEVEVNFAWSRGRVAPANVPASIRISDQNISVIRSAVKMFREIAPAEPVVIQGFVAKLSRPQPNARGGEITIHGFIDRDIHKVKVQLSHDDYQQAVVAHERYKPVACRGELIKSGSLFRFSKPDGFIVLDAVDFDAGAFERRQSKSRIASPDQFALDFEK